MKKSICLICSAILILAHTSSNAQNVGINVTNPQESLDVKGNIMLTGTIMPNGNAGQINQVLTNNGDGTMAWKTTGAGLGYKNSFYVSYVGTSFFTVPAGVTTIMAEVWGAGAGGSGKMGGMSGSYGRITKTVSAGNTLQILIGSGGAGQSGVTNPTSGGSSKITFPDGDHLEVFGGGAPVDDGFTGTPGSFYLPYSTSTDYFQAGNFGEIVAPKTYPSHSGRFVEVIDTGKGGLPPGINYGPNAFNSAQYVTTYDATGSVLSQNVQRQPYITNFYPGTGGGYDMPNFGLVGGNGLVIIWW